MSKLTTWMICVALSAALVQPVFAADNELTPEEKAAGWQLLFNGNDYNHWRCNNGRKIASKIEDHCLVPHKSGGYLIIYDKEFSDFVLTCDVKMDPICNSGVFVRVGNPKDPVQTGFEVQVASEIGTGKHDFGSLYDLVGPKKVPHLSPDWNTITVTCKGPHITAAVNGETVAELNCDEWTTPGHCPDGSKNKFSRDQRLSATGLHWLSGPRAQGVVQERQDSRTCRKVKPLDTASRSETTARRFAGVAGTPILRGGSILADSRAHRQISSGRHRHAGRFFPWGFFQSNSY